MVRRGRRLSRPIRRRQRQVLGFTVLMVVAVLILAWARYASGYTREVLINVGASVVIVAMSYAIFDPIFEEIRRARVQEQPYFDDVAFCHNVARASREVRIMDTCNHMLEGANRVMLLRSLSEAARRRASVQILLLDPDSAAAAQRAGEISPVDVRAAIIDNLRYLHECRQQLPVDAQERLQVRVYDALPSIQFFQHDYRALVSFFPAGGRAWTSGSSWTPPRSPTCRSRTAGRTSGSRCRCPGCRSAVAGSSPSTWCGTRRRRHCGARWRRSTRSTAAPIRPTEPSG